MVYAMGLLWYLLAVAVLCARHRYGGSYGSAQCLQKKNSIGAISSGYHISDRDDGHDDDDGSSRSYPSRTLWGTGFHLAEKFPFLFERRFGIAAYDFWYGYSACQIDLGVMDGPVVNYNYKNKKSERSMFGTREEVDEMEALADAWKAQNGDGVVGQEISLSEFIKGKV